MADHSSHRSDGKPEKKKQKKRKLNVDEAADKEESELLSAFKAYQLELDEKHDRHERLVKTSRDVTSQSKKIIFLLHRVVGVEDKDKILAEADEKFGDVRKLVQHIAMELRDDDSPDAGHRYRRAYRMGIQEYVEALGFSFYCRYGRLVTYDEVVATTQCERQVFEKDDGEKSPPEKIPHTVESSPIRLFVDPLDYVLGIADLTGECMRLCINSVGSGKTRDLAHICDFVRGLYSAFSTLDKTASSEIGKKMNVMAESLRKIETTCYNVIVRGSECPQHVLIADNGPANRDQTEIL